MKSKGKSMWYWIGGITALLIIVALVLTLRSKENYYEKELKTKEVEIQRLLGVVQEQESIASRKKGEVVKLYRKIADNNAKLKRLKRIAIDKEQAIQNVPVQKTVEETVQKLKEHGLNPEVKCD
ncbi:MAG: hypothetical protein AB1423_14500 [Pseudomonadota bacterium]